MEAGKIVVSGPGRRDPQPGPTCQPLHSRCPSCEIVSHGASLDALQLVYACPSVQPCRIATAWHHEGLRVEVFCLCWGMGFTGAYTDVLFPKLTEDVCNYASE